MKVKEAFEKLRVIREDIKLMEASIADNPFHSFFEDVRRQLKRLRKDAERLEELIYNQELDDSYDQNGEDV